MRPSRPVADHVPAKAGRSPTRKLIVQIVPANAVDPAEAVADFVAAIGDLLLAEWLAHHAPVLNGRNLTVGGAGANTRRPNAADEERPA
jgi:hypothetical protein